MNLSWKMRHQIFCHFEIQTDLPISTRRPNLLLVNRDKRTSFRRFYPSSGSMNKIFILLADL